MISVVTLSADALHISQQEKKHSVTYPGERPRQIRLVDKHFIEQEFLCYVFLLYSLNVYHALSILNLAVLMSL